MLTGEDENVDGNRYANVNITVFIRLQDGVFVPLE